MNSFIFKFFFFEDFCLEDFTRSREGKTIWSERPRYIIALQSRSEILTFDFMAGRLLQESTRRQASLATNGNAGNSQSAFIAGQGNRYAGRGGGGFRGQLSQRAMRFGGRGRASFGSIYPNRFRNAAAGRGGAKRMLGKCHYCQKEGH